MFLIENLTVLFSSYFIGVFIGVLVATTLTL